MCKTRVEKRAKVNEVKEEAALVEDEDEFYIDSLYRTTTSAVYSINMQDTMWIQKEDEDEFYIDSLYRTTTSAVYSINMQDTMWIQKVQINNKIIDFKLDTGAEINVLPLDVLNSITGLTELTPSNISIIAYGSKDFKIKSKVIVKLMCQVKDISKFLEFVIVDVKKQAPLLGLKACVEFGLIARIDNIQLEFSKLEDVKCRYKQVFEGLAVLRKEMLTKIRVAHQGIEKTKARARQVFTSRREPLNVYELPERPWQRLAADIFSYGNHSFLVVMDAYSNWLEVVKIQSKSTEEVIRKFMSIFSKFGCPDTLVCDNIPFGSEKMKAFAREWNFNIVTRSPNYPRSNGLGEKAVGIAKKMVKQSIDTNKEIRMCKTKLPVTAELLMPKIHSGVRAKLKKRQEYGRKYYDQVQKVGVTAKSTANMPVLGLTL
ncbi:hypothetical protein QE152_g21560 [Popillia japonica]|uniref:Integrase catalytic domain-containing protein n=1 Tax=Popillia japonica TaxID=7064 RepID=A0AAW1KNU6_POPJA